MSPVTEVISKPIAGPISPITRWRNRDFFKRIENSFRYHLENIRTAIQNLVDCLLPDKRLLSNLS